MYFCGLRLEYALEGSSNYIAWNDRMEVVLEDNRLKEFIDSDIHGLVVAYAQDLAAWKKNLVKERRFLLKLIQ